MAGVTVSLALILGRGENATLTASWTAHDQRSRAVSIEFSQRPRSLATLCFEVGFSTWVS